jgi:hypothetical protein
VKRKLLLGTGLTLTLVVLTILTVVVPTLAVSDPNKPQVTKYFTSGKVILQLPTPSNKSAPAPPGTPSHPVSLELLAYDLDRKSTFGAHDELYVALWIPQANSYVPVAFISDNDAAGQDFHKMLYTNIAIWSTGFENVIAVADEELEIWTENSWTRDGNRYKGWGCESSDVFIVNLTKAVTISLPWNLLPPQVPLSKWGNQTFTLLPMTLEFREIGDSFYQEATESLVASPGFPPMSDYTVKAKGWRTPAWIEASLVWINYADMEFVGRTTSQGKAVYVPPA